MLLSEAVKMAFGDKLVLKNDIKDDFEVSGLGSLESANKSEICYIIDDIYLKDLEKSRAGAVLIRSEMLDNMQDKMPPHIVALIVDNPHLGFALLSQLFGKINKKNTFESASAGFQGDSQTDSLRDSQTDSRADSQNIHKTVKIASSVSLGRGVKIGANTTIMPHVAIADNVEIGKNCRIYPNVVIYSDSVIGDNVLIHAGSVIGSDGFGYAQTARGEHEKIEHSGKVVIEDDVEIGANNVIDRAVLGESRIKRGSKIGHSCVIAHNSVIGEHSLLVAQVGLAGSTTTGRNVVLGGQVGVGGHVHLGDFVQIGGKGTVTKNLPPHTKWNGYPLMPLDEWMRFYVRLKRMLKREDSKN